MTKIPLFEMERYQSEYWHVVAHDLSESGVLPMTIRDLLGPAVDAEGFLASELGYPLSEGGRASREAIADWYAGATIDNVTMMNGGSEANLLTLWSLLRPDDRFAFMVPNYLQGLGLGRVLGKGVDTFRLVPDGERWALDLDSLDDAVGKRTRVIMLCNPNNPTGGVLTEGEMEAVIEVADRAGAWIVADEIYRGAEVDTDATSPTFWGRYERAVVTGGLSKAFAMPGLRVGWAVAPPKIVERIWRHHDYTTLTPGIISDQLTGWAMQPPIRESILGRTRAIIRANLPPLEAWFASQPALRYRRPVAGAIAFAEADLPISTREFVERVRVDQSVLLVPGEMFGIDNGIRIGFGYRVADTLQALALVGESLAAAAA
jgi:aspartate/methionine/tyrosine aminotransferase